MPSRTPEVADAPVRRILSSMGEDRYEVGESRSVRSVWVWRGFLLMAMVAAGIALVLAGNGADTFAVLWGVIAAGWFAISMVLWRMHSTQEEQEYQRLLAEKRPARVEGSTRAGRPGRRSAKRR